MSEYVSYIVNHIKSNLVNDYEKDMKYLHDCSEKYKNDEESQEILGAIAALMYEILPDAEKKDVENKLGNLNEEINQLFEEVKKLVADEEFEKAKPMMEEIIKSASGRFEETSEDIYLSLNHIMELYEYSYYFPTSKNIKCTDLMYNEFYRYYGVILGNLEKKAEAEEAFLTAIKWNPVDLESILCLADLYITMPERIEDYLKSTIDAHRYCCTRSTMARYYRNMARYYLEKYEPRIARALYVYSNIYFQSEAADSALDFIKKALNEETPEYTIKELQKILEEKNIELGPNADTIGIIYRVGNLMLSDKDYDRAKDCFAIVYDITQDEATLELLSQIMNMGNV